MANKLWLLAILALFGSLPPILLVDVYAKWPIHDYQHEMGQYARLLLIPMAASIVLLGVWRFRTHVP